MLQPTLNPLLVRSTGKPTAPTLLRRHAARKTLIRALEVSNAVRELSRLPEADEYLHVVMRGNFPAWSLVPAILRLAAPSTIDRLAVATLGFNKSNAVDLLDMLDDGRIRDVTFLCSVYFQRANPTEFRFLSDGLTERGHSIAARRSHAKIIAAQLTDGRCYTVESSANLRSCRNLEQFTMSGGVDLFEFHAAWIRDLVGAGR